MLDQTRMSNGPTGGMGLGVLLAILVGVGGDTVPAVLPEILHEKRGDE